MDSYARQIDALMRDLQSKFADTSVGVKRVADAIAKLGPLMSTADACDPFDLGAGTAADYARVVLRRCPWVETVAVEHTGQLTVRIEPYQSDGRLIPQAEAERLRDFLRPRTPVTTIVEVVGRAVHAEFQRRLLSVPKAHYVVKNIVP